MKSISAKHLAQWTHGEWKQLHSLPNEIHFQFDSRKLSKGECFIAIKTHKNDGHRYLNEVKSKGACAAIVSEFHPECDLAQLVVQDSLRAFFEIARYYRKTLRTTIIGITGSYGKTSTTRLLALLLGEQTFTTHENENNALGVALNLTEIDPEKNTFAVIETGIDHVGEMSEIEYILRPDHVIFTALSFKHLEHFSSQSALFQEKIQLAKNLYPEQILVVPSEWVSEVPKTIRANIWEVSNAENSTLRKSPSIKFSKQEEAGIRRAVLSISEGKNSKQETYLLPESATDGLIHNLANCWPIITQLGITPELIQKRILEWKRPHLRGELFSRPHQKIYLDCYNSDGPALLDAANYFVEIFPNVLRLFVLGEMVGYGSYSAMVHQDAAQKFPANPQDYFILLGDGMQVFQKTLLGRGFSSEHVQFISDRKKISQIMEEWQGAIFIKGSRLFEMETLMDFDKMKKLS